MSSTDIEEPHPSAEPLVVRGAKHTVNERISLWLVMVTVLVVATGMAYTLGWPSVVRHTSFYWLIPGDIWGTVRASHWIGWGDFSFIYSSRTGLVTLPGFHLLFTPVVVLCSRLGLAESAPGFIGIPKPSSWLLIGPVILACSAVALFGCDALARAIGAKRGLRRLLTLAVAGVVWPTIAIWGHPEDVVALGIVAFALAAALRGRWTASGWLLGAAVATQLYVIALVPLFIGVAGLRRATALIARALVIPAFIFIAVFIPNPHATLHALLDQPNYPTVDHPTPWVHLAPRLGHGAVAAGPSRIIGLVVATAIGVLTYRRRDNLPVIVWCAGLALSMRCLFESVMDPYYVMPAVAVALIVAATLHWVRFTLACMASAGITVLTYFRPGEWVYWLEMVGVFLTLFALTVPQGALRARARAAESRDGLNGELETRVDSVPATANH
jgi:hypothetical protein